jgi:hypothetical protein
VQSGESGSGSRGVVRVVRAAQQTDGRLEFAECPGGGSGEVGGDPVVLVRTVPSR